MKRQVVIIHGGDTFDTYKEYLSFLKNYELDLEKLKSKGWKKRLPQELGSDFEVISPRMPNSMNAKYKEWEIMFEKLFPFLKNNLILIGHSLGGIFLAKYLSENKFPKKIKATFLIAPPYDDKNLEESLGDFNLQKELGGLKKQGGEIYIYYSKDDPLIPLTDLKKYRESLSEAEVIIFKNKGHFRQTEFPEIVKAIKNLE